MTASYALHSAWTLGVDETDRRFNRILAITLVVFLVLSSSEATEGGAHARVMGLREEGE